MKVSAPRNTGEGPEQQAEHQRPREDQGFPGLLHMHVTSTTSSRITGTTVPWYRVPPLEDLRYRSVVVRRYLQAEPGKKRPWVDQTPWYNGRTGAREPDLRY